ncbi:hypothetical protein HDU98_004134 [Podochytrium sp. JEL0797]|nr:hypothetical protein HDU98_004134 [Podochytrium sp. JEL0797]
MDINSHPSSPDKVTTELSNTTIQDFPTWSTELLAILSIKNLDHCLDTDSVTDANPALDDDALDEIKEDDPKWRNHLAQIGESWYDHVPVPAMVNGRFPSIIHFPGTRAQNRACIQYIKSSISDTYKKLISNDVSMARAVILMLEQQYSTARNRPEHATRILGYWTQLKQQPNESIDSFFTRSLQIYKTMEDSPAEPQYEPWKEFPLTKNHIIRALNRSFATIKPALIKEPDITDMASLQRLLITTAEQLEYKGTDTVNGDIILFTQPRGNHADRGGRGGFGGRGGRGGRGNFGRNRGRGGSSNSGFGGNPGAGGNGGYGGFNSRGGSARGSERGGYRGGYGSGGRSNYGRGGFGRGGFGRNAPNTNGFNQGNFPTAPRSPLEAASSPPPSNCTQCGRGLHWKAHCFDDPNYLANAYSFTPPPNRLIHWNQLRRDLQSMPYFQQLFQWATNEQQNSLQSQPNGFPQQFIPPAAKRFRIDGPSGNRVPAIAAQAHADAPDDSEDAPNEPTDFRLSAPM